MVTTTQVEVTQAWSKISDGDCTVQSDRPYRMCEFSIGEGEPTEASLLLRIDEPVTLAYGSPVWCRLRSKGLNDNNSAIVNIIK